MNQCDCDLCKRGRRFKEIVDKTSDYEDAHFLEVLEDHLNHVEMDLDWHRAVADGSWPSAIETLEGWLENARKRKEAG